jgi:ankyrin repeat protein
MQKGLTPLLHCARIGREDMCEMLLNAGAHPRIADLYGTPPLTYAARAGNAALARMMLSIPGVSPMERNHVRDGAQVGEWSCR